MEARPEILAAKIVDSKEAKAEQGILTDAETAKIRKIAVPEIWYKYCKSTWTNRKLHSTFSVANCRRCKFLYASNRNLGFLRDIWISSKLIQISALMF